MKNKLMKIVTAATLALAMVAAPMAAMAAGTVSTSIAADKATVKAGDKVNFSVTYNGGETVITGVQANVSASENLRIDSITTTSSLPNLGGNSMILFGGNREQGATSITVNVACTVLATAVENEELTLSVDTEEVSDDESNAMTLGNPSVAATVTVADSAQEPTNPDNPSNPDTPSNPSNPSNPSGGTTKPSDNKDLDDVPKTGDVTSNMMVYMVVAIAAAGAIAVVSAKKFLAR